MLKTIRRYMMPTAITVGVFAMVATAFAVAGEVSDKANDKAKEAVAAAASNREVNEEVEVEAEGDEASDGINHGHCVSYWSHAAKDQGLEGRNKGEFVSSIAQNEEAVSAKVAEDGTPDSTCDFQSALDTALTEQEADDDSQVEGAEHNRSEGKGGGRGKSDEEHGKDVEGS